MADDDDPKKTRAYEKQKTEREAAESDDVAQALKTLSNQLGAFLDEIKSERTADAGERHKERNWQRIIAGIGTVIAFFTLAVLIRTCGVYNKILTTENTQATIMDKQRQITEQTLPAMQAQATAAIRAAENGKESNRNALNIFRATQRPFISLGSPKSPIGTIDLRKDAKSLGLKLILQNSGKTPAFNLHVVTWDRKTGQPVGAQAQRYLHKATGRIDVCNEGEMIPQGGEKNLGVPTQSLPSMNEFAGVGSFEFPVCVEYCDSSGQFYIDGFMVGYDKSSDAWDVSSLTKREPCSASNYMSELPAGCNTQLAPNDALIPLPRCAPAEEQTPSGEAHK